jgi:hypothetical protein
VRVGDQQLHLFERPGGAPRSHHVAVTVPAVELEGVLRAARELAALDGTTFGHHLYELPGD